MNFIKSEFFKTGEQNPSLPPHLFKERKNSPKMK